MIFSVQNSAFDAQMLGGGLLAKSGWRPGQARAAAGSYNRNCCMRPQEDGGLGMQVGVLKELVYIYNNSRLCMSDPSFGFSVRRARGARALEIQDGSRDQIGAYLAQDFESSNV